MSSKAARVLHDASVQRERGRAPARSSFARHSEIYVDRVGRVYTLPVRRDRKARMLMRRGVVGEYFEPQYEGEDDDYDLLEDDESSGEGRRRPRPRLEGSVYMYVWRPKNARHTDPDSGERISAMPKRRGAPGASDDDFVLYEANSAFERVRGGARYRADVASVEAKRRAQRGQVVLENVSRLQ